MTKDCVAMKILSQFYKANLEWRQRIKSDMTKKKKEKEKDRTMARKSIQSLSSITRIWSGGRG